MDEFFKIEVHATKTLKWWNSRRELIDFNPPYQRKGRLWSSQDKAFLIDSILNGFDIPKLYIADYQFGISNLNLKKLPYAIIDGKQRLEAIFDFFDNRLFLDSRFIWRIQPDLRLGGLSLRDLQSKHPSVAEEFENASLTIMSVFTNNESLINELFVRLNRSKALTGAEVRNAMLGAVPDIIRKLGDHPVFRDTIKFSTKRAGDLNAAAKILLFEYDVDTVSTKKSELDRFASGADVDHEKLELAARRAIDTLDEMEEIFLPTDPLLASSGVFPVYYWFVRLVDPFFHDDIRPFLVHFERERQANRELQKINPDAKELIPDYARYDTLNRSTNDAGSHKGRVEILKSRFSDYLDGEYTDYELKKIKVFRS